MKKELDINKLKILNDSNFKKVCESLYLDPLNAEVYNNSIIIPAPYNNLYFLFDLEYDLITIDSLKDLSKEEFANREFIMYRDYTGFLKYPFENYSLMNLIKVYNNLSIIKENNSIDKRVSSYIEFIGEIIRIYHEHYYFDKSLGYNVVDIYKYLNNVMCKIDSVINSRISYNEIPHQMDICLSLGKDYSAFSSYDNFNNIIDLILDKKGYKIENRRLKKLNRNNMISYRNIANELLELTNELYNNKEESIKKLVLRNDFMD